MKIAVRVKISDFSNNRVLSKKTQKFEYRHRTAIFERAVQVSLFKRKVLQIEFEITRIER